MRTQSEIEKAYNDGRSLIRSFNKNLTVNTTVGISQDLSGVSGNPVAQYFLGPSGESTQMSYLLNDKGIDHGGTMDGYKKFIHGMTLQTVTAALAPSILMLMDYLMFYSFIGMDTGLQNLTNSVTLPRYSRADGIQMMMIEQNPYSGGATVQVGYTNQDGVSGRVTPVITLNGSTSIGTVATSAPSTAGSFGNFLPLQSGDYSVEKIDTIEFLTGDVGTVCLLLCKLQGLSPFSRLFLFRLILVYLPEVKNDAYLNFILKPAANGTGAVTNTIFGNMTTIWKQV